MTGGGAPEATPSVTGLADDPLDALVSKGVIRLGATTTADLDRVPRFSIPEEASPLDLLLADRAEDDD